MKTIRIGSRDSLLAVIQSDTVKDYLTENGIDAQLVTMKTTGDKILDKTLDKIGGKGLFVKELDQAILDGRSDMSVHSLKDMPMEISEKLPIIAYSVREDPRDVLVLPEGDKDIDFSKPIGTSSFRRKIQIRELYPQARVESVRGNVITRLKKLDDGLYSALVLAASGMIRLGLEDRITRYFSVEEMLPAAGQGIMAVQGSADQDYSYMHGYNDEDSETEAEAERAFVRWLDGGCSSPIAAFAQCKGESISIEGLYYDDKSGLWHKDRMSGSRAEAEKIGIKLAMKMKSRYEKV